MMAAIKRSKLIPCYLLAATLSWQLAYAGPDGGSNISATRHNLTATGPGPIKVAGATEVCKFCHTPHASNPVAPLWNRADAGTYYQTYESSTLVATVGQPTGSSRLCLSCHDGTVALTQTYNPRNAPSGSIYISAQDKGYIGTDLRDDHPISFVYDSGLALAKGELAMPDTLPEHLALDKNNQLQCTTCHDPHDNRFGKFLTMNNDESRMCTTCHQITGWATSSHATSNASLIGAKGDTWDNINAATVRQASCGGCHRPHSAGGMYRLMRREAEEDNCLPCHDGTVASKDIGAELAKFSSHPVASTTGVHDPTENVSTMQKHVECADCHKPHNVTGGPAVTAPRIKPSMGGVWGVTGGAVRVDKAPYEYQVCYKCHAGTRQMATPVVDRVVVNTNTAREFAPGNPSFHPVETQGVSQDVPSLLQAYTVSSIIYCTDCHGSNTTAVKGPHGSSYRPLLVRNYVTLDRTRESPTAYALCYGCHNRSSILGDQSFSKHSKHIKDTPCSVCHDPHGISYTQGTSTNASHLINFDRNVALPAADGSGPTFRDDGVRKGSCTLKCHNKNHADKKYGDK